MQERIVEIILFLVNELKSNKQLSEVDVSLLTENGYTQSEISTAFSWLFERLSVGQQVLAPESNARDSFRILHDAEKMVITPEAYGYMMQCRQLGLLTNANVETIIERIMAAGFSSVGVPEMKTFIAGMLVDGDIQSASFGRISLTSDDTIH
jgi:uncharacterized protein Smg (DUF494 family)